MVKDLRYQRFMFAVILKDAIADMKKVKKLGTLHFLAVESLQRARGAAWMRYGVDSKISIWLRKCGSEMQFLETKARVLR